MQAPTHFAGGLISDLIPPIEQIACPIASHKGRLADSQWGAALLATTVCRVSRNSEHIRLAGKQSEKQLTWREFGNSFWFEPNWKTELFAAVGRRNERWPSVLTHKHQIHSLLVSNEKMKYAPLQVKGKTRRKTPITAIFTHL